MKVPPPHTVVIIEFTRVFSPIARVVVTAMALAGAAIGDELLLAQRHPIQQP